MSSQNLIVPIDPGIRFITQWMDQNGNFKISQFLPPGRKIIVNKKITGCGFTSFFIFNNENTILVAPRTLLIRDKVEQANKEKGREVTYYFNREQNKGKSLYTVDDLRNKFTVYQNECMMLNIPMKIFVTYDSFAGLIDMLENDFGYNIDEVFRIAVDESHCIIKDVMLKENINAPRLSQFLSRLFMYSSIVFISATPIYNYMQEIPEFKNNEVDYIELQWDSLIPVNRFSYRCISSLDAFDKIYNSYVSRTDENGRNVFDVIYGNNGQVIYSYEGIIFLNDVTDIARIIKKYIDKLGKINPSDVMVICSDNQKNSTTLSKLSCPIKITKTLPKNGDPHPIWTFATRTSFEGVDMYHPTGSTFVIANYSIESLAIDIASDIPQIIGRLRRDDNPFKYNIHIYYKNGTDYVDTTDFIQMQNAKMNESRIRIETWNSLTPELRGSYLIDLTDKIRQKPNDLYIKTVNGLPEINNLLIVNEQYCHDILNNQTHWFVALSVQINKAQYGTLVEQLRITLQQTLTPTTTRDRIWSTWCFIESYPHLKDEVFFMLNNERYKDIARFFSVLTLEEIKSMGYNSTKLNDLIRAKQLMNEVRNEIPKYLLSGQTYSKKQVKSIIQSVYDKYGIQKTAKATDLKDLGIQYTETKVDGKRSIRIL